MKVLTAQQVTMRWGELEPRFAEAMAHGDGAHGPEYIGEGVANGTVAVAEAACGVIAFHIVADRLHIIAAQGTLERAQIRDGLAQLAQAAAGLGLKSISLHGRRGWQRVLAGSQHDKHGVLQWPVQAQNPVVNQLRLTASS